MKYYKEFRADGWPFCPNCEEDELYSHLMINWHGDGPRPTVDECVKNGMTCYRCNWSSTALSAQAVLEAFTQMEAQIKTRVLDNRHLGYMEGMKTALDVLAEIRAELLASPRPLPAKRGKERNETDDTYNRRRV